MCDAARKSFTLAAVQHLDVQRFFEVGVGRGDVAIALAKRGLRGRGIDFSEDALRICSERIERAGVGERLEVCQGDLLSLAEEGAYDLIIALEVLEHIDDDRRALATIRELLKPKGHFLISVPAHMSKWAITDVWGGHVRRYERAELREKLEAAGFEISTLLSYGFPLLNLARHVRNVLYARDVRSHETVQERTKRSGFARPAVVRWLGPSLPLLGWLVMQTQRPFLRSDLGVGYFVVARRVD